MAKFVDGLEYKPDPFEVIPRSQWRVMGTGIAKKSKKLPRLCRPSCEFFKKDIDGGALCQHVCVYFIMDTHVVHRAERVLNILFGKRTDIKHLGVSWWVGERYFREFLGDSRVDKMIKQYMELRQPPEDGVVIGQAEDKNEN